MWPTPPRRPSRPHRAPDPRTARHRPASATSSSATPTTNAPLSPARSEPIGAARARDRRGADARRVNLTGATGERDRRARARPGLGAALGRADHERTTPVRATRRRALSSSTSSPLLSAGGSAARRLRGVLSPSRPLERDPLGGRARAAAVEAASAVAKRARRARARRRCAAVAAGHDPPPRAARRDDERERSVDVPGLLSGASAASTVGADDEPQPDRVARLVLDERQRRVRRRDRRRVVDAASAIGAARVCARARRVRVGGRDARVSSRAESSPRRRDDRLERGPRARARSRARARARARRRARDVDDVRAAGRAAPGRESRPRAQLALTGELGRAVARRRRARPCAPSASVAESARPTAIATSSCPVEPAAPPAIATTGGAFALATATVTFARRRAPPRRARAPRSSATTASVAAPRISPAGVKRSASSA